VSVKEQNGTQSQSQSHTHTHTDANKDTQTDTDTQTQIHTHTHTHTHTHRCKNKQTNTNTRTGGWSMDTYMLFVRDRGVHILQTTKDIDSGFWVTRAYISSSNNDNKNEKPQEDIRRVGYDGRV
jgi:hypothetical protein